MEKIPGFTDRLKYLLDTRFQGNRSLFAKTVGVSEAKLRTYETGVCPGGDTIVKIATVLEISCDWILLGIDSEKYSNCDDRELVQYLREKDRKIESLIARCSILETKLKKQNNKK